MSTNKDMEFNGILASHRDLCRDDSELEMPKNRAILSYDYRALKDFLAQTIDSLNDETAESMELREELEETRIKFDLFLEDYRELLLDYMVQEERLGEIQHQLRETEVERDEQSEELARAIYQTEKISRRYDSELNRHQSVVEGLEAEIESIFKKNSLSNKDNDSLKSEVEQIKGELEETEENFGSKLAEYGRAVRIKTETEAKKQIKKYQWAASVGITAAVILGIALATNSCEGNEYSMSPSLESTAAYQTIKGNGN